MRILKEFKSNDFGSADCKGVMGAFFGSADSKEVSGLEVERGREARWRWLLGWQRILSFTSDDNIIVITRQVECLLERHSNVSAVTRIGLHLWAQKGQRVWSVAIGLGRVSSKPAPFERRKGCGTRLLCFFRNCGFKKALVQ